MLRRCPRCGQSFDGHKEQRLCPECREAAQRAPRIGTRTCKTCGKTFEGGPRAWYCPECRAERQKTPTGAASLQPAPVRPGVQQARQPDRWHDLRRVWQVFYRYYADKYLLAGVRRQAKATGPA